MHKQAQPKVVIPISKRKVVLTLVGCLLFIGLGIALVKIDQPQLDRTRARYSLAEVRIVGAVNIAICVTFFVFGIKQLFKGDPGLILDRKGITLKSAAVVEQIKWTEIERITITKIRSQKFITLHLRNPEKYLRGKSWFYRFFARINMKYWGSPIHFSPGLLQIRFDELITLIQQYHEVALD